MIKMSCPYCEKVRDVEKITKNESIKYKGKNVIYEATHYKCSECNEIFDTPEMMDSNLLAVKNAYETQYEPIEPKKIIAIRKQYNASQKAFGLILGMGELTINSYETGKSIPNATNRLIIQLSENPLIFFEMYQKNQNKIGATQRERIESSKTFKNCKCWGGLDNLYYNLSSVTLTTIKNREDFDKLHTFKEYPTLQGAL